MNLLAMQSPMDSIYKQTWFYDLFVWTLIIFETHVDSLHWRTWFTYSTFPYTLSSNLKQTWPENGPNSDSTPLGKLIWNRCLFWLPDLASLSKLNLLLSLKQIRFLFQIPDSVSLAKLNLVPETRINRAFVPFEPPNW